MAQSENIAMSQELLTRLGSNAPPDRVLDLFADDMTWDIPGDPTAFPWIGRHAGRDAVRAFLAETQAQLERIRFEVEDIIASDTQAVVLGALASRVRRTGRLIETGFAIVLTVAGGRITRFRMLEDSFAVAQAAHGTARAE
jgi:ketosteroid isomerase-like protein